MAVLFLQKKEQLAECLEGARCYCDVEIQIHFDVLVKVDANGYECTGVACRVFITVNEPAGMPNGLNLWYV